VTVAYYMDHHFHGGVTRGLRARGIDCLTAEEDGQAATDDDILLDRATAMNRVMVSSEADMLAIAGHCLATGHAFAGLVYGHQLRITVGGAIADLQLVHDLQSLEEMRNQVIWMPL
jgi:hypothetical protein